MLRSAARGFLAVALVLVMAGSAVAFATGVSFSPTKDCVPSGIPGYGPTCPPPKKHHKKKHHKKKHHKKAHHKATHHKKRHHKKSHHKATHHRRQHKHSTGSSGQTQHTGTYHCSTHTVGHNVISTCRFY